MKRVTQFLLAFLMYSGANAQDAESYDRLMQLPIKKEIRKNGDVFLQGDFTEVLTGQKDRRSLSRETMERIDNTNLPTPSVATLKKYLREAAKEFNVPFPILDAIAKTYNNYAMIGPSEYGAYGIMGLIENETGSTLAEASKLTEVKMNDIKTNARENIRAAAALLSSYAGKGKNPDNLLEWFDAVKQLSGLNDEETREMQAIDYYRTLNEGRSSITLWKENAAIEGLNNAKISKLIEDYDNKIKQKSSSSNDRGAIGGTVEYPGAVSSFTSCNFSSRNGRDIDTLVNHYIAVGTVAGAISWFRTCRGDSGSSAHFIIAVNGTIHQIVSTASKAWHAGASGRPNNERSIGVEHDVTTSTPGNWNSIPMLRASTDLARFFCNRYNIPKTRSLPGIRGHKEMPGTSTDCPYTINWTNWMNLLNSGGTTPPPVSTIPTLNTPAAGASVASPVNLTWSTSVSGASCRIQVSKVNTGWTAADGFTTETAATPNVPVNYSTAGLLNYTWPNEYTADVNRPVAGNTYYWTVRSYSAATGVSSYSPVRSFTVTSTSAAAMKGSLLDGANLVVYPNPGREDININFNAAAQEATLSLFDITGKQIFEKNYTTQKGANSIKENIAGLQKGMYILMLNDGEKVSTQNVVIQ